MQIVNETNTAVWYTIACASASDCGNIPVDGMADLPAYDNQTDINVTISPVPGPVFILDVGTTTTGEQVEMALTFE